MTTKEQLENKIAQLESALVEAKKELAKHGIAEKIRDILESNEGFGIKIASTEVVYDKVVLVRVNKDYTSDFSMSYDSLKNAGYTIKGFRNQNGYLYVWFAPIN